MMCTYGPAEGSTQSFVHAWLVWVNINAIRCKRVSEKHSYGSFGQPLEHQPDHRQVDERLRGLCQELVVSAHPAVARDPREGALRHPLRLITSKPSGRGSGSTSLGTHTQRGLRCTISKDRPNRSVIHSRKAAPR